MCVLLVACILSTATDLRKKRPPKRLSQRPNDIYVNRKSDFASQLARSHKLLDQGYNYTELVINHTSIYMYSCTVNHLAVCRNCTFTVWVPPSIEPSTWLCSSRRPAATLSKYVNSTAELNAVIIIVNPLYLVPSVLSIG